MPKILMMISTTVLLKGRSLPRILQLYFVILLLLSSLYSTAQNTNGTISGQVLNNESQPVAGASVFLKGQPGRKQTDDSGHFRLTAPAGSYELTISFVGYSQKKIKVKINAGTDQVVDNLVLSGNNEMNEVNVLGKTQVKKAREQAFSLSVIDTKQLYNTSADLNQVMNRTYGVRIREDGGVGSNFNFSLNGFSGKQVKFFLDGIPIDNLGSSLTLNNFPVNMAERIEVYKGVTPINLGGDALGGAVNIVTRSNPNYIDASYGFGSFNTHRPSFNAAYTNAKTGFTVRTNMFYNYSDNDYKVDVQPIDLVTGQKGPYQRVKRFHDKYESGTAQVEVGVTGKKYADKLLFGLIASGNEKDIQTGVTMEQVFGARTTRSSSLIPTVKYKKTDLFIKGLDLSVYGAYNMSQNRFIDTTRLKYNWLQQTISTTAAELSRTQLKNKDNEGLATANLAYKINAHQAVSYNYVLTDFKRKSSDSENPDNPVFLYPQKLAKQVMGLAWQTDYNGFTATLFTKLYLLNAKSFEQQTTKEGVTSYQQSSLSTNNVGYGVAAAYFVLTGLQAKASFEHTYRLPEATELLGDGLYVRRNSALKPENSNNLNLGALYTLPLQGDHKVGVEGNFIYRKSHDFIRLDQSQAQPIDRQYINVGDVQTTSVEGEVKYSWKDKIFVSANMTYQNIIDQQKTITTTNFTGINTSPNFYYNSRLPNMPFLFGNADIGTVFKQVGAAENSLNISYSLNYVQKYFLTSTALGADNQDIIPQQFSHNLMAGYSIKNGKYNIALEGRNLADNRLFDNYLLQKPGRSFFIKLRYFISK
jgi:outer membrane receptor protein involved in Fe transport